MKTIKLLKLKINNFKGIKSLEITDFTDETLIFGANGTGKTSIFDSICWLWFGKDSTDKKDFNIKNTKNPELNRQDHEVEAIYDIDGELTEIKRVYSEKWVKQRGNETATFTGHETSFFWNGVPMKQIDFQKQINGICDEFIFKLITSPTAFNALNWKDRRNILVEIAGEVSNDELVGKNKAYQNLIEKLAKYNSEEDYKKMLQASVKKAKEEISVIPSRIDEVSKSKPEAVDFKQIKKQIEEKQNLVSDIDSKIENSTVAFQAELDKINAHNAEISRKKSILENLRFEAEREARKQLTVENNTLDELNQKIQFADREIKSLEREVSSLEDSIKSDEKKIENISAEIQSKRDEWNNVNAEECKDSTVCPSCEQSLPESKVEEIINRFKTNKSTKLNSINAYGRKMLEEKESVEKRMSEARVKFAALQNELTTKQSEFKDLENQKEKAVQASEKIETKPFETVVAEILEKDIEYSRNHGELLKLENSKPEQPNVDNSELKAEKQNLQSEIDDLKSELNKEIQIKNANERISELENREKEVAQQIASVDKEIFVLEEFTKLKVDEIEKRVRGKFSIVSFRMFKEQINGGLEPTCETLIDGVPFTDANTASKINAGIDIINTLSKFYGVTAPIFLDNRESVTDVIETDSQLVNLIVSPSDKKLRIQKLTKENVNA